MIEVECKDCTIKYEWKGWCATEHPNLCCDCYDEEMGMPESRRHKPRPKGNNESRRP